MADEIKLNDSDRFNLMLALTGLLVDGEEYTVEELVEHFKVPKKEIVKAVKMISYTDLMKSNQDGSYEVDYDDLREGFVSIRYTFSKAIDEVPRLSSRQASALAAGLVYLSSLPGLVDNSEIEELQKILASDDSTEKKKTVLIETVTRDSDLVAIREAMASGFSITCDYLNLRGETTLNRELEPLRIDSQGEVVYLRAWCPVNNDVRSFRLDRMRNAKPTANPISEAALGAELVDEIYTSSETDTVVTLEVDPEAYSLIYDFKPVEEPESVSKTVKRFKIHVGDVRNLGRVIARFGGAARVISPEIARQSVRDFALNALGERSSTTPKDAE
jgi:proteasome accessory factor C